MPKKLRQATAAIFPGVYYTNGDRIIVSDMRAWDAFERLQLRSR